MSQRTEALELSRARRVPSGHAEHRANVGRALPPRRPDRVGWVRDGLPCARPAPRARRRPEGPRPQPFQGPGRRRALRSGGPDPGGDRPSERGRHPRRRAGRSGDIGRAVPRYGPVRRGLARRSAGRLGDRGALARGARPDPGRRRGRSRCPARSRHRPPRPQAVEHPPRRRPCPDRGSRHRRRRAERADRCRHDGRYPRLPRPGAARWRAGEPGERRSCPWRRRLPRADRAAPLARREPQRDRGLRAPGRSARRRSWSLALVLRSIRRSDARSMSSPRGVRPRPTSRPH